MANDFGEFPLIGADKQFLIRCDGQPFAGASSREEALEMTEMYRRRVRTEKNGWNSANATKHSWSVDDRGGGRVVEIARFAAEPTVVGHHR